MGQAWCRVREREQSTSMDAVAVKGGLSVSSQRNSGQTLLKMANQKNYFGSVDLGPLQYQVILFFPENNPLGPSLSRQCQELSLDHSLAHSSHRAWQLVAQRHKQTVLLVDVSPAQREAVEELLWNISNHHLEGLVTLVAVMSGRERLPTDVLSQLTDVGFSRFLTAQDCVGERFTQHIQQVERAEVKLKQQLVFGQALFAAVEQSNDAIRITDSQSKVMYVNTAFVNLTGYSQEETVGKPSIDIVNQRTENGPTTHPLKKWDGECTGRRKSGTALKQHLKLIPVSLAPDQGNSQPAYHVTIQKLLGALDDSHRTSVLPEATPSPKQPQPQPQPQQVSSTPQRAPLIKTQTLPSFRIPHPHVDTPIAMVAQTLAQVRESPACPPGIKEELDKAMEVLRTSEPYAPLSDDLSRSKGIVYGLLYQPTRRFTVGSMNEPPIRTIHPAPHLRHSPATPPPQQLQEALENVSSWDFDILHVEKVCEGAHHCGPLYYVGTKIFKDFNMSDTLGVDESVITSWMKLMESHYRVNSYHSATHAADVLHAAAYLVKQLQDNLMMHGDYLEQTEIAAILISAVVHDLDHPGFTNPFLCNSKAELATLYNDKSVLENHHVSLAFRLTEKDEHTNIFQSLDTPTYRTMRGSIIDMVLATDMSGHFEHLTKFTALNARSEDAGSSTSLTTGDSESRVMVKRILVKCADISNPCRPMVLCREWANRIAQEYFKQTEEERGRGLPIMFPDFDRKTCNIPSTQIKFIDFFITGLFESWDNYCPISLLMDHLISNLETWKNENESSSNSEEERFSN